MLRPYIRRNPYVRQMLLRAPTAVAEGRTMKGRVQGVPLPPYFACKVFDPENLGLDFSSYPVPIQSVGKAEGGALASSGYGTGCTSYAGARCDLRRPGTRHRSAATKCDAVLTTGMRGQGPSTEAGTTAEGLQQCKCPFRTTRRAIGITGERQQKLRIAGRSAILGAKDGPVARFREPYESSSAAQSARDRRGKAHTHLFSWIRM